MKFSEFAITLENIEKASSRNLMKDIVSDLIKVLDYNEVGEAMYLMQGRVVPRFISLEFNVAEKLILRVLEEISGKGIDEVESVYRDLGDLGLVAEKYIENLKSSINIKEVYDDLKKIASLEGEGSVDAKINHVVELLKLCDSLSSRYIVRIIIGDMRLGVSDKSILDALSVVLVGDKSKRELLDKVYGVRSDIGYIVKIAKEKGVKGVKDISINLGIPIASMNCEREETFQKILERFSPAIVQPKYDGLRCQVHYDQDIIGTREIKQFESKDKSKEKGSKIMVFSRNLEDLTDMFPELLSALDKLKIKSVIFDCEVVGFDPETNKLVPFQKTMKRKRKYEIKDTSQSIPINAYVFDILYCNGKSYLDEPLSKRVDVISLIFKNADKQDVFKLAPSNKVSKKEKMGDLFDGYVQTGLEGIIAKNPSSEYYPGKRGFDWIKFKKSKKGHLIDNIDSVVLGYFSGYGDRAKFGIGAFLVGVKNENTNKFESIAKVGTGVTDCQWKKIKDKLDSISVGKKPRSVLVSKQLKPNVWVKPEVVAVVEADEITKSPNHMAGMNEGKGYSLRFPRMFEFDRKDKNVDDITTVAEVKRMYNLQ